MSNRQQFPGGGPGGHPGGFPGGGPGGHPGGGFPGGGPGGHPGGFPGGGPGGHPGGHPGGAPLSGPPQFIPVMPAFHGGSMRVCLYRNTYVWMNSGSQFWFFPTFVSRSTIVGFRWRSRFGWTHHVINPRNVLTFQCF